MTIQTFEKTQTHIQATLWEGGREAALEICRWVGRDSSYIPSTSTDPFEYIQIPTMFGPRDMEAGNYVVRIDAETFLIYKPEALNAEYKLVTDREHPLIQHARNELNMFPNEDIELIQSIMAAVKGFASYRGHSGSSAEIAVHMVAALLRGQNLLPLTDDPEEWEFHAKGTYGVEEDMWQNKRNSKALSMDGGKSYFLVNEKQPGELVGDKQQVKFYQSQPKDFKPEIDPEDLESDNEKAILDEEWDLDRNRAVLSEDGQEKEETNEPDLS